MASIISKSQAGTEDIIMNFISVRVYWVSWQVRDKYMSSTKHAQILLT